jgi:LysM repeat protein
MGQLEKYGLYVLCLVIFLILGVTIWGGGDLPPQQRRTAQSSSTELNANPRVPAHSGTANGAANLGGAVAGNRAGTGPTSSIPDLDSLLSPVKPPDTKKAEPKVVDAASNRGPDAARLLADASKPPAKSLVDPTGPSKPPADAPRPTHKVQRGDTFDSIAKEKLGAASLRTEIARLNPRTDPTKLRENQELVLPTAAEVAALTTKGKAKAPIDKAPVDKTIADAPLPATPAAAPGSYVVAKGDTFGSIALRQLGSSKRVNEIADLNPDLDPTRLKVGKTIRLPKK